MGERYRPGAWARTCICRRRLPEAKLLQELGRRNGDEQLLLLPRQLRCNLLRCEVV
jgi:hypothetical protein